jgi:hypothetical protein
MEIAQSRAAWRAQRHQALRQRSLIALPAIDGRLWYRPTDARGIALQYLPQRVSEWVDEHGFDVLLVSGVAAVLMGVGWLSWSLSTALFFSAPASAPIPPVVVQPIPDGVGVPGLDDFIHVLETAFPRLGLLMAMLGGLGTLLVRVANPFNAALTPYLSFLVTLGVFGALTVISSQLLGWL